MRIKIKTALKKKIKTVLKQEYKIIILINNSNEKY
jgi:hypothetical protein